MSEEQKLKIGERYDMIHFRKGRATVEVLALDGEWIDVLVMDGGLKGMGAGSARGPGDTLRVRESLAKFNSLEAAS